MARDLFRGERVILTGYFGGDRGRCVQLTALTDRGAGDRFVSLTKADAARAVVELLSWLITNEEEPCGECVCCELVSQVEEAIERSGVALAPGEVARG